MTYLVDANVLSEPTKPAPQAKVIRWLRDHEKNIAVEENKGATTNHRFLDT